MIGEGDIFKSSKRNWQFKEVISVSEERKERIRKGFGKDMERIRQEGQKGL